MHKISVILEYLEKEFTDFMDNAHSVLFSRNKVLIQGETSEELLGRYKFTKNKYNMDTVKLHLKIETYKEPIHINLKLILD